MTAPKFYKATLSREKMKERGYDGKIKIGELFDQLGARNWTVAEEVGAGGYEHYQCSIEFKSGKDWNHLKSVFAGLGDITPAHKSDNQYEIKDGNYFTKSDTVLLPYADLNLYEWQKSVLREIEEQNEREITVIIDEKGCNGKTWLTKYLEVNHILKACPVMSEKPEDYIAYCMAVQRSGYCFDFPRAENVRSKRGLWSAVERIKDGQLYDGRYHVQETWIAPPKIVIFTNEPDIPLDALSKDRWRIFYIGTDLLTPHTDLIRVADCDYTE